ncbi:membrane protein insertase YidC [Parasutterella secunda]|jgi:YidC/Oxa1 family membrane protein insertase|uniref:membrane protein insertase YidC n=1 Tax=Parasutterella secunda TaxID=626947 RepID=UPI0021ACE22D|nr:membrane protein insertase YidC [Parasutterella secunda]MCR8920237.1 membrane protein insertase YidC [Parasutterella secunda]MDM8112257.1 membrane protein insertase YidC [Parasutterella secunda]MDM8217623.1 membrane protein insertase YidC [Parasutterella secunda]MDM8224606.1 membrane protein insertase YidC [Parasutterella secunda]
MGRELQRAFLWMIFLLALFMLWDAWQVRNGNPSFFGTPEAVQEQVVENANTTAAAGDVKVPADSKAVASEVNVTITQPVVVTTDLFKITFDANGASVARAELLKERQTPDWKTRGLPGLILGEEEQQDAGNVVLFDTSAQHVYKAETGLVGGNFPNHRTAFRLISDTLDMKEGQDTLNVSFAASQGNVELIKTYVFHRGHYGIDVKHEVRNKGNVAISPSVYMQLTRDDGKVASDSAFYNTFTGPAAYTEAEKFQKIDFDSIADNDTDLPSQSNEGWIAMLQHYFLTAWVPQQDINRELYTRQLDKHLYAIGSIVAVGEVAPGAEKVVDSTLYVGPQDQRRLEYIAPNLDLVVDYGWLTFLAKPIYWLLAFLQGLVGNWGWAIVLLTVLVKAILYPISAAGYKSMARMRDVAPRMKAIQEKYGNDKQALNQAMMELYRREKINPAGGCFPILLQIPVFLALYWVLLATVELRGASWLLWVNDLASPDPYLILPLLMVATMIIQMKISPRPTDPTQAKVMMIMPVVFGVMFFFFASGLVLYWLTNNVLSIWQQWYVNKQIEKERIKRTIS